MSGEPTPLPLVSAASCSLQGRRSRQEDAAGYLVRDGWAFLIVADGMGGVGHGDFASQKACDVFLRAAARFAERGGRESQFLENTAFLVNGLLLGEKRNHRWADVGTTAALVLYRQGKLTVAHAGDSRVYLVTRDDVQLLTRDHAPTHELLERGLAHSLSQARQMVGSGVTRSLGDEGFSGMEVREVALPSPCLVILTTDGAHEFLEPADFLHQATGSTSVADLTRRLARLALERGSQDNITVVAGEIGEFPRGKVLAAPITGLETPPPAARQWLRWVGGLAAGFVLGWALSCGVQHRLNFGTLGGQASTPKTTTAPAVTPNQQPPGIPDESR